MQRQGIGAIVIEPGASLDYFTGIQWWRSERLTAAVIPAEGDPIIVTPFFEKPSVEESLKVPAEIRTWNEDEEPLKLVADFLKERKAAAVTDRLRGDQPLLHPRSAAAAIAGRARGQRQPGGARAADDQVAGRAGADAVGGGHHDRGLSRYAGRRSREGMTPADIDALFKDATLGFGGTNRRALILLGEAVAPTRTAGKPQEVKRGEIVLLDCGCSVHGYQSDISRTFVFGRADRRAAEGLGPDAPRPGHRLGGRRRSGRRPAASTTPCAAPTKAGATARATSCRDCRIAPATGSAWRVHEPVNLVHGETTPLAPGMCFSNEPGIYLPGKFGVRLEDCFHMTASGPKYFTRPPPSIDRPFG